MLRSLYSGISGLRAHQTMLDVAGNNIANVNTVGFKASTAEFEDTLSQVIKGAGGAQDQAGGTNPAQIGLGVKVAAISTNFTQGSAQATGKATDLMINGDGFFTVQVGGETLYTRNGAFGFDSEGRLVTSDGAFVQGWTAAGGVITDTGAVGNITLTKETVAPAQATTSATFTGNLPGDAAAGTVLTRDVPVYDALGNKTTTQLAFTKDATGWSVTDGTSTDHLDFTDGQLQGSPSIAFPPSGPTMTYDFTGVTSFAGVTSIAMSDQDGREAGTLESYSIGNDGTISGSFSNGAIAPIARIALSTFANPGGLEKAGGSTYRASANSGAIITGPAGSTGLGTLSGGYLEMSNVDLSQEFTNLIVAQRGFQANARIITTSDEVLQELTNLKR